MRKYPSALGSPFSTPGTKRQGRHSGENRTRNARLPAFLPYSGSEPAPQHLSVANAGALPAEAAGGSVVVGQHVVPRPVVGRRRAVVVVGGRSTSRTRTCMCTWWGTSRSKRCFLS